MCGFLADLTVLLILCCINNCLFHKLFFCDWLNNDIWCYLGIKVTPPSFYSALFPRQNVRLRRHFTDYAGNAVEGKPVFALPNWTATSWVKTRGKQAEEQN